MILDARYEKVRHGGHVRSVAVLVATGVNADGRRSVIGREHFAVGSGGALARVSAHVGAARP